MRAAVACLAVVGALNVPPHGRRGGSPTAKIAAALPLAPFQADALRSTVDVLPAHAAALHAAHELAHGASSQNAAQPNKWNEALSSSRAAKAAIQRNATAAVLRACDDGESRATVVLPGGSGKTVLGLQLAEALRARGEASSVLLPTLDLVTQTIAEPKGRAASGSAAREHTTGG